MLSCYVCYCLAQKHKKTALMKFTNAALIINIKLSYLGATFLEL